MDRKEQIDALRAMALCCPSSYETAETLRGVADTLECLSTQLDDLRILWDMYGGEEGITAAFQKAAERDAAVEDLRGLCWCCAHGKRWEQAPIWSTATTCKHMQERSGALARSGGKCKCPHWVWRGPQKGGATP